MRGVAGLTHLGDHYPWEAARPKPRASFPIHAQLARQPFCFCSNLAFNPSGGQAMAWKTALPWHGKVDVWLCPTPKTYNAAAKIATPTLPNLSKRPKDERPTRKSVLDLLIPNTDPEECGGWQLLLECQDTMPSSSSNVYAHLLPPSWKGKVAEWLKEDCPSFDWGGFVVGEDVKRATLWCKTPVGPSVESCSEPILT